MDSTDPVGVLPSSAIGTASFSAPLGNAALLVWQLRDVLQYCMHVYATLGAYTCQKDRFPPLPRMFPRHSFREGGTGRDDGGVKGAGGAGTSFSYIKDGPVELHLGTLPIKGSRSGSYSHLVTAD